MKNQRRDGYSLPGSPVQYLARQLSRRLRLVNDLAVDDRHVRLDVHDLIMHGAKGSIVPPNAVAPSRGRAPDHRPSTEVARLTWRVLTAQRSQIYSFAMAKGLASAKMRTRCRARSI